MRDPRAAYIMGDLLAHTLLKAYESNRLYLFGWEREQRVLRANTKPKPPLDFNQQITANDPDASV